MAPMLYLGTVTQGIFCIIDTHRMAGKLRTGDKQNNKWTHLMVVDFIENLISIACVIDTKALFNFWYSLYIFKLYITMYIYTKKTSAIFLSL